MTTDLNKKNGASFEAESEYLYKKKILELEERIKELEAQLVTVNVAFDKSINALEKISEAISVPIIGIKP